MAKRRKKRIANCNIDLNGCGSNSGCGGAVYGLGFIGSAIYYISTATTFWTGVLGLLKAIVWPAFLVHAALNFLAA